MSIASQERLELGSRLQVGVVDCDVHPTAASIDEFVPHVPQPWRDRFYAQYAHEAELSPNIYVAPVHEGAATGQRVDAMPANGGPAGSDPDLMECQLLRDDGVDFANLIPMQPRPRLESGEFDSAVMAASNGWMSEVWLGAHNWHGRYRGALRVSPNDPVGAAREIEAWAGHRYFNQVYIPPESGVPYGHPSYDPIWAAAERHGLPISMHLIILPGQRWLTPVGFSAFHLESYSLWFLRYVGQLTSMVLSGVFEKFPRLRVVALEAGIGWLPPLMWRLDNHWEMLRSELPHLRRRPSNYLREHVRVATQPLEEPSRDDLLRIMEWCDAARMVMFSTDYPHYDFDSPAWMRTQLPQEIRSRVMVENAAELFGLPRTRPADRLDLERAALLEDERGRRRQEHGR